MTIITRIALFIVCAICLTSLGGCNTLAGAAELVSGFAKDVAVGTRAIAGSVENDDEESDH